MFLYSLGTIYDLDFKIQQRRNEGNKPITAIRRALQRLWVRPLGLEFTRGLCLLFPFVFVTGHSVVRRIISLASFPLVIFRLMEGLVTSLGSLRL